MSSSYEPRRRRPRRDLILGCDPFDRPSPRLVVAVARADATGVLQLVGDCAADAAALDAVTARTDRPFAVRVADLGVLDCLHLPASVCTLVLAPGADLDELAPVLDVGWTVLAEVTSVPEARAALAAGVHGIVGKGSEAGGRIGDTEAFVLLQQLSRLGAPVWVRGGIGLHTAPAAVAAGAQGVVLDAGLALARECELPGDLRRAIRAMDGSETRVVGGHRIYTRPDLPAASVDASTSADELAGRLGTDLARTLVPVGQDAAVAGVLADRFVTAGGITTAVLRSIAGHIEVARATAPLAPGAGVAASNGTRVPVAQGPMTRVSDRAAFAAAVADGGGLPFLALALLRGPEVRTLLEETAALLGDRPWGVGVLGFVPPELRAEQLEAVEAVRPPVALIAGGRPSQAAPLEANGIRTYLHAPSPGLVESFAKAGARRFVFEGRECGGHVGPRSSFVLWEAAVDRLLALDDPEHLDLLFAGGIHDAASAAAVAALAAPLVERGARIGVLMGTSYLFTEEAVANGAITATFQHEAVTCDRTVLLETAPGHATRCADTPFVTAFTDTRTRLEAAGAAPQEIWGELETLNLGRLRIASKGIVRDGDELREVDDEAELRREGMFMIGQVATLRDEVTTIADLHASVTTGSTDLLDGDDLAERAGAARRPERPGRLDIAIVGMSAFLPGSRDVDEFWANVLAGSDAVTEVPATRWDVERYYDPAAVTEGAGRKTPSKWGGFLPAIGFDALAYGIPPRSLASIETVQLLALEAASRALADAGYATREFDRSRASVIFGAEAGTDLSAAYGLRAVLPSYLPSGPGGAPLPPGLDEHLPELTEDSFPGVLTNVIAGRIANRLDLGGVNYTVDAACAASLAALDLACKELVAGSSDLVLCGGADLHNGINDYLLFSSVHALSAKGRCATFDAEADGIALGEGVACVVLKRLSDAERDGDRVYAVIEAVSGSSDGRALGLTAPRAEGQRRALERAYEMAERSPSEIGLVEAHGTGTVVGDATELATLTEVFTEHGAGVGTCALGSVKSQVGHTKCAAGLAGLIKTANAVYRGVLPPTIHLDDPNPGYHEDESPFRFADRPRPWVSDERRAGVSAFGFGGANFHAVLAGHTGGDEPRHGAVAWPAELFLVRGDDRTAALGRVSELAALVVRILDTDPDGERHRLRDLARTVSGEGSGPVQVALVADDLGHLARQLAAVATGVSSPRDGVFLRPDDAGAPDVAFLFPGQGSQRVGMLADVFVAFPSLRRHLRAGGDVVDAMFPPKAFGRAARDEQKAAITDTRVAQPALGVADLALADLLGQAGVRPAAAAGHSYGELVALAVAGAYDEAALHRLSTARGAAVHAAAATATDPGAMAAVACSSDDLAPVLARHPEVVLANHNGPTQCVLAGPTAAVDELVAEVKATGTAAKRLPVACAFHSPIVASARDDLAAAIADVEVSAPAIPVWSNAAAAPYPSDPTAIAERLADQVASPVRFVEQVEEMYAAGSRVFVEVGPGRVLTGLVRDILGDRPHHVVACDVSGEHGVRRLLLALAELAALGVDVDPSVLFEERAEVVDLAALPVARPGWIVDGHLVRTVDGAPVAGGLRPATENPVLGLGGPATEPGPGTGAAAVVSEYLRNLREAVAAERDVVLRYLGATAADLAEPRPVIDLVVADAPPPAAVEAPAPAAAPTGGDLLQTILEIVGDRTGYPLDMLDPDLDLEADLSIDSIKRIEIIGELAERVGLPGAEGGAIDEAVVEELAQIKTLRGIVEWLDEAGDGAAAPAAPATPAPDDTADADADADAATAVPDRSLRCIVGDAPAPFADGTAPLPAGAPVLVTDDGSGAAAALVDRLGADGLDARLVASEPLDPEVLRDAGAVVHLSLGDAGAPHAFDVLGPVALTSDAHLVCVSAVDGTGGEPGLLRSLRAELPGRVVRSLTVDAGAPAPTIADLVAEELAAAGPVEVALTDAGRVTREVAVVDRGSPVVEATAAVLEPGSVVLLTGGARGITARFAQRFAAEGAGHVALVGRSALPEGDEAADLRDAATAKEVRQALLARGDLRTPAEVEAACRTVLAEREIRATLAAVADRGATVSYHAVDVRDGDALAGLVSELRAAHGRLDGVVHGAGVIEDRFLRDKTSDSYRRVYDTKVSGAWALLGSLATDAGSVSPFVVLFGSVSGVFGNRGQVDYAAANDALDALARAAGASGPLAGRVLSIDWGPWGGSGMVSDELAREYHRRGIGLIEPDDGVDALCEELAHLRRTGRFEVPQVVVARAHPDALSGQLAGQGGASVVAGGGPVDAATRV